MTLGTILGQGVYQQLLLVSRKCLLRIQNLIESIQTQLEIHISTVVTALKHKIGMLVHPQKGYCENTLLACLHSGFIGSAGGLVIIRHYCNIVPPPIVCPSLALFSTYRAAVLQCCMQAQPELPSCALQGAVSGELCAGYWIPSVFPYFHTCCKKVSIPNNQIHFKFRIFSNEA